MTRIDELHKKWLRERPGYAKAYAELEDESQLARGLIGARARAGLTQEQLAGRMKTTRTMISRLESGRMKPSTRTLERYARDRSQAQDHPGAHRRALAASASRA
jgi:ribosome-binding protein aMBF1 (putative translation factor)